MEMERQEFRGTRTRVQHGILLSAFLALVGLASLYFAGPTVRDAGLVGAVALLLSLGVLIVVLRGARDPRARMVLDRDGIWFRDWEIEAVSWAAVRDAYRSGSRVQTFITIRLRDGEHFLAGLLTDEPFGWREAIGGLLIVAAGALESYDAIRRRPAGS